MHRFCQAFPLHHALLYRDLIRVPFHFSDPYYSSPYYITTLSVYRYGLPGTAILINIRQQQ
jgi:hypothetical protein